MKEKIIHPKQGVSVLILLIVLYIMAIVGVFVSINLLEIGEGIGAFLLVMSIVYLIVGFVLFFGFRGLQPSQAVVLTLFGKYIGTIKEEGFYYVHPFSKAINPAGSTRLGQSGDVGLDGKKIIVSNSSEDIAVGVSTKKISLKIMTLNNQKQKVNDALGNPVEVGVAVMWRVIDTAKAVFEVDNYKEYLSLQVDSAVRHIVQIYPYDVAEDIDTSGDGIPDEGSLRGSTAEVAQRIKEDIQKRVNDAGLEIIDARITYLAYAKEIAAVMLQRQQARAVVDARRMIVDGAVGIVAMALEKLEENKEISLTDEQRAQMVSNLLVVLVGNRDVQPVVSSNS